MSKKKEKKEKKTFTLNQFEKLFCAFVVGCAVKRKIENRKKKKLCHLEDRNYWY